MSERHAEEVKYSCTTLDHIFKNFANTLNFSREPDVLSRVAHNFAKFSGAQMKAERKGWSEEDGGWGTELRSRYACSRETIRNVSVHNLPPRSTTFLRWFLLCFSFSSFILSRAAHAAPFFLPTPRRRRKHSCTTLYYHSLGNRGHTTTISASRIKSEVIMRSGDLERARARVHGHTLELKGETGDG